MEYLKIDPQHFKSDFLVGVEDFLAMMIQHSR